MPIQNRKFIRTAHFIIFILTMIFACNCSGRKDATTHVLNDSTGTASLQVTPIPNTSLTDTSQIVDGTGTLSKQIALLDGKWQSTTDETAFITLSNIRKSANGEVIGLWDNESFVLSDKCKNESDKAKEITADKLKYISLENTDMCYDIIRLDATHLELSYMSRGNTLAYRRAAVKW